MAKRTRDNPPARALKKLRLRQIKNQAKSVLGEFGPSGEEPIANSMELNNAVRAKGVNLSARTGIKHRPKR